MITKCIFVFFILVTSVYGQVPSSSSSGPSKGGIPLEFLFSPMSYSESETSTASVSTFSGSGMTFRGGISFGFLEILGNFETVNQVSDLTVDGISQNKKDTGLGVVIKLKLVKNIYLGAGYSLLDSTITNTGADTAVSELSGTKMYALIGYNLNLFGSFKLFGEGTYIASGEYVSSDGVNFSNPIIITGLGVNVGIGISF